MWEVLKEGSASAVYVWLVDSECVQYDKPCWIAVADGEVDGTGEEVLLRGPDAQQMLGILHCQRLLYLTAKKLCDALCISQCPEFTVLDNFLRDNFESLGALDLCCRSQNCASQCASHINVHQLQAFLPAVL